MADTLIRYLILCVECRFCFMSGEFYRQPKPTDGHFCPVCKKAVQVNVEQAQ